MDKSFNVVETISLLKFHWWVGAGYFISGNTTFDYLFSCLNLILLVHGLHKGGVGDNGTTRCVWGLVNAI